MLRGLLVVDPSFWVVVVIFFAGKRLAPRQAIGALRLLGVGVYELQVEEEDRCDERFTATSGCTSGFLSTPLTYCASISTMRLVTPTM
jgi:hypothetical protein